MEHHPDGRTSAASNFLIRLRASGPWGMSVWTVELQQAISISAMRASGPSEAVVQTVEVESAISILVARAFGPRLTDVRTGIFEFRFLPYGDARRNGIPHRPNGRTIFPLSELGKNLRLVEYREASGRAAKTSGRMMLGLTGVRTVWHVVQTDGTVVR
jgi:hypothetical protein